MQPVVFKLPDLGEGVVEAEIVAWHVKPGEQVRVDQPLVEVMTDKATVTIPSGIDGRVVETRGEVGETVAVGSELVRFDLSPLPAPEPLEVPLAGPRQRPVVGEQLVPDGPATVPMIQRAASPEVVTTAKMEVSPVASPAVRRRARELHVDLQHVAGSGPNGRILHGDIDGFLR